MAFNLPFCSLARENRIHGSVSERILKIVIGYHAATPPPPHEARSEALTSRVAFLLDTRRLGSPDMAFDAELFTSLVGAVAAATPHDRAEVWEPHPTHLLGRILGRPQTILVGGFWTTAV
jgi:hypothetical protein